MHPNRRSKGKCVRKDFCCQEPGYDGTPLASDGALGDNAGMNNSTCEKHLSYGTASIIR